MALEGRTEYMKVRSHCIVGRCDEVRGRFFHTLSMEINQPFKDDT